MHEGILSRLSRRLVLARGYRNISIIPVLHEVDYCSYCLCHPCVNVIPLDFLVGTCGPHPANDEKSHRLYRKFWKLLLDLGVWNDEDYLRRKEDDEE